MRSSPLAYLFKYSLSLFTALQPFADAANFFSFLILTESVGRGISPSQGRYLVQTQNKHKETYMPWVGFETTIPVFERAKTVHALDRAATVIGIYLIISLVN
jgi:hypothetical protein